MIDPPAVLPIRAMLASVRRSTVVPFRIGTARFATAVHSSQYVNMMAAANTYASHPPLRALAALDALDALDALAAGLHQSVLVAVVATMIESTARLRLRLAQSSGQLVQHRPVLQPSPAAALPRCARPPDAAAICALAFAAQHPGERGQDLPAAPGGAQHGHLRLRVILGPGSPADGASGHHGDLLRVRRWNDRLA